MSLIRQIWLLLALTFVLAFAGSVAVNVLALRASLQAQLATRNADNAQALAIALSQQRGDRQTMEMLMSAQFDTGHYQRIRMSGADGAVLFDRSGPVRQTLAPAWFVALIGIHAAAGTAQVSDGWKPVGSVEVLSQAAEALDGLWRSAIESALWLLLVGLAGGMVAVAVLRAIRLPLESTVRQAEALTAGEFVRVPEPNIPELRRLTQAMNAMVERVRTLFEAQAGQVEALRRQAHHDALTGVATRAHFLRLLDAALEREDGPADGGLVLLRLRDLAEVNRLHGHEAADRAILAIAQALQVYPQQVAGCFLGRLNGADFALHLPAAGVARETAQALAEALRVTLPAFGSAFSVALGSVDRRPGMTAAELMGLADSALATAESRGAFMVHHHVEPAAAAVRGERAWRAQLLAATAGGGRARLVEFPVVDREHRLVHLECPMRVQLEEGGDFEPAALWLPQALRARLTAGLDAQAVAMALAAIRADGRPRGVNIAPASLADGGFVQGLAEQFQAAPEAARQLGLEIAEDVALDRFALLQAFGRQLRPYGVALGLEHAGARLTGIERLYEAGLEYVKLDASVTRGLARDGRAVEFVRTTIALLRALSLRVYAEGVADPDDAEALWRCGIDGVTGPWVDAESVQG